MRQCTFISIDDILSSREHVFREIGTFKGFRNLEERKMVDRDRRRYTNEVKKNYSDIKSRKFSIPGFELFTYK